MKIKISFIVLFTIVFGYSLSKAQDKIKPESSKSECFTCHKANDLLPKDFKKYDVHLSVGLTCAACHGGNSTSDDEDIAMNPKQGFIGVPSREKIPKLCGKCHSNINYMRKFKPEMETDQVQQYYTSLHGKQLRKGDKNVAVCISCHTAHAILPSSDPRSTVYAVNVPATCNKCHGNKNLMKKYNLSSSPYKDYAKSVHGIALLQKKDTGAPACNDCHGNHGAMPPGVNSIDNVCGNCHINNMKYFENSSMGKAFKQLGYHGCIVCHSNHLIVKPNDNFVGVGKESFCIKCHDEGDEGYKAAKEIHSDLTTLASLYKFAINKLKNVREKGMSDIDINFRLKKVHQTLIQARTVVHTFNSEKVAKFTNKGIKTVKSVIAKEDEEINEFYVRRYGFLIAVVFITVIIIALYLKNKELDKKLKSDSK